MKGGVHNPVNAEKKRSVSISLHGKAWRALGQKTSRINGGGKRNSFIKLPYRICDTDITR